MKYCARQLTLAAMLLTMLSGCAATGATVMRASGACIAFSPITFSAASDTTETVRQVRGHNAAWDAICTGIP